MVIKILVFLGIILTLIIGAHLVLYKAVIRLFVIDGQTLKSALFTILFLLSLSFMASFFLLQWQENPLTIGFYMFSATWTGMFVNLLLAVLLSWIICAVAWFAGRHPNTRLIAAGCLILAVLFSAYGVWNAFHPRIKKLSIEFENLPAHWKNKTIVQLSDVHLGHIFGVNFLKKLVEKVNALNPDLIFITGDLFDGMAADISHFATPLDQLKANKGVFFITGNHETYVGLNRALNALKKTRIHILNNEVIEIEGLQIIGISYPGIQGTQAIQGLATSSKNPADTSARILLFHTPTNISLQGGDGLDRHFATYWVPDTSFTTAEKLGVDLQFSGHTHAGQLIPFGYLTKLLFKGYDYGFHRRSRFSIYTTSGIGTWGPPMRTGNSPEIVVMNLK